MKRGYYYLYLTRRLRGREFIFPSIKGMIKTIRIAFQILSFGRVVDKIIICSLSQVIFGFFYDHEGGRDKAESK